MPLIRRISSEKQIEANRQNARRSTGPRTPAGKARAALNALDHGRYAHSPEAAMNALGEDPEDFRRLLDELTESYQPANAAERLQLERIAWLHWEDRRNHYTRLWKLAYKQEEMRLERERQWLAANSRNCAASRDELMETGLINRPDSPAKFSQLLEYVGTLIGSIQKKDFTLDYTPLVQLIYGKSPNVRGNTILNHLHACAESSRQGSLDETAHLSLLKALYEEERDLLTAQDVYFQAHVEISPARRNATLAAGWDDRPLIFEGNALSRQLERAYRIFFAMRQARKSGAADPEPPPAEPFPDPLAGTAERPARPEREGEKEGSAKTSLFWRDEATRLLKTSNLAASPQKRSR